MMDLESIRREYLAGGLRRENLLHDPMDQFELWMEQAIDSKIPDPTAMTLATVDQQQRPSQRIVLLKHVDAQGFVFFTNYGSAKARDIMSNSAVSLHFPWHVMERQVVVAGCAHKVATAESVKYFHTRPRDSQLAAWASKQSQRIDSREQLMAQYMLVRERFSDVEIPLPDFWGGFRVVPDTFEFWQGGGNRLHDRFCYAKKGSSWCIERLSP